ncbi:bifunctional UDP-N-acetylmuramoyl-tripeptide:D-alanyl-D-alanine ligase/alanine racemase [Adhaeribacter rhizoryzae]|uniref:Alanine racemase n=1 Tax=Adhaeribacter rhizoryzae TaxID=2607907 RepID=A0A5M6DBV7_9BACT|nr:bifunctional UDP-N-acetylmuramoyl-tripeptide:D-alanyl-D-alanine ligase/alanine racemase [Adhaeribacter rhizoryzae]KAA5543966.1 bifunctional UDP-N-acetylmuramoyl-tripeptide:D-alanyl-D-alanine ligase/alanine racemase [Adhaeribacter rhizoryzae]
MLTSRIVAGIIPAQVLQYTQDYTAQHLLTDSRKMLHPASSVFFAIKGAFHNGHTYVPVLYAKGVRQFILEDVLYIPEVKSVADLNILFPEANFWQVESSLRALQQLAAYHRSRFSLPVFAITGSNGKTIVKEWLAQLLSPDELVCKSPRSYNSQIGVPLSVWQLNEHHTLGIFEAGISKPAEMEYLRPIIKPTYGIFTNIGSAHNQGFASRQQKIAEKLKLFTEVELLFYCQDHTSIHEAVQAQGLPAFTWSRSQPANLQIISCRVAGGQANITFRFAGEEQGLLLPYADEASIENMMHCLAVLLWRGLPIDEIQHRLNKLLPVAMRLEMKEAINNCYLIDDTYNNDLAGLGIALDLLLHQPRQGKKTLILSDVLQSGLSDEILYRQVADVVKSKKIDRLIGIGATISRHQDKFEQESQFYTDTDEFLNDFKPDNFRNETILVKGARIFQFEQIVAVFQRKVHGTVLEVNLDALVHNLNYYRAKLQPATKIMVMVKAFAYGSGSYEIANILQFHRVDYLAVAYTDEGVHLRENGISLPIMVMNPSPDSFAKIQQYHLEPEIYSLEILQACLAATQNKSQPLNIHIKLDTGMHRLGFTPEDLATVAQILKAAPQLRVVSTFSHLAGADEALHNSFSQEQVKQFREMAAQLEAGLGYPVLKHILNSAGIVRFPEHQLNMVRLGIGLYGVEATGQEQEGLRTVGTLKTTVSQVKEVPAGETVGYSRRGVAATPKKIATIAIGYADGYDRRFGNGVGQVWVNGQLAPIIGNICMDMCMVDVTGLSVHVGDAVEIFGEHRNITQLAQTIGTIPYELLTNVSARVKRIFFAA